MSQLGEVGEISTGELLDGRYRLEERIGEGATARVYRAEDTLLGRTVAIKLLRGPLDDLGTPERAQSETAVLAALNHHGLVTLFDARVSEYENSYLVMEYVEGITLRDRIHQGRLESAEAASIALDIAEGLHVAHLAGIVHRDIKPSNILLWRSPVPGQGWRAKIADFGIAYLLDSARLTTPGLMIGTVAYIAPEQARGAAPAPPADIYALGIVLIEALTGTRPFADAEGIGAVMVRLQGPPPIPESLDPRWQQLLRGMTAMLPGDRPTALDVAMTASRIAAGAQGVSAADVDQPTGVLVQEEGTERTAILPVEPAVAAMVPGPASASEGAGPPASVGPIRQRTRRRGPRRRALFAAIVLGVLLVAAVVTAAIWTASSSLGSPDPVPSQPVQEQVVEPSVTPTPSAVTPADDTGTTGPEVGVAGNGTVNPNSGPGNNNGNGNDKDKGGKKGKG